MLKPALAMRWFIGAYVCICSIQLYAAYHNELFGDEAFYWLESLWLSWSYTEVPGWTPWTLALADRLFPDHPFYLRLPSLLAAFSLPRLAMLLARGLGAESQQLWYTGLLVLALPLLSIAGIMAIPDIWIIFFTLLAMWLLIRAIQTDRVGVYVLLGLVLALGVNVHIRFWVIILITCVVIFWHHRHDTKTSLRLITFTLPGVLIGLVPIAVF